jgi:aryl-alcohol dehydrogenase-like predicted oxidoreductase
MGWILERITPAAVDKVRQLTELACDLDATTAQLAIAWVLRRKEVSSVITGATRLEQLDENLAAADFAGQLSDDLLDKIDVIFHEGE